MLPRWPWCHLLQRERGAVEGLNMLPKQFQECDHIPAPETAAGAGGVWECRWAGLWWDLHIKLSLIAGRSPQLVLCMI